MMHEILTALLYDVLKKLKANKEFFALPESERNKILTHSPRLPDSIVSYLSACSEEAFMKNIGEFTAFLSDSTQSSGHLHGNLFKHLADFGAQELASNIDLGDIKEVKVEGACGEAIREAITRYSYQEATDSIDRFLRAIYGSAPTIVVQSARIIPGNVRLRIREELQKKHPHSVPIFSINTDLLGGIRVFVSGTVNDYSWRSKINQLISL